MNELRVILTDEQLQALAERVAEQLAPAIVDRATVAANEQQSYRIDPLRLYDVDEAAAVLGIAPGTLYNMSDQEMPRQGCGRGGGKIKFYGRDLLAHLIKNYTGRRHPHAVQKEEEREASPLLLHKEAAGRVR